MDPRFLVLEIQSNVDGSVGNQVTSFAADDRPHAEAKYHTVLSAAAISPKPLHACVLMTAEGFVLESKCYHHEVEGE